MAVVALKDGLTDALDKGRVDALEDGLVKGLEVLARTEAPEGGRLLGFMKADPLVFLCAKDLVNLQDSD